MICIENGIHLNIADTDYFEIDAISQSSLKKMEKCPAYFKYAMDIETDKTDAMIFGSAFHALILQPDVFDDEYFVTPKITRRGKAWDEIKENAEGKEIIWNSDFSVLEEMRDSINNHHYASQLLDKCANKETTIIWDDDNLKCKGKIDGIFEGKKGVCLIDLKTTRNASKDDFINDLFKNGYHIQAAFYLDGFYKCTGNIPKFFIFIAIEKEAPYLTGIYTIAWDSEAIMIGRKKYKGFLKKYNVCKNTNIWSGIGNDEPIDINVPNWYLNKINRE